MEVYGPLWKYTVPYGSKRSLMKVYGHLWKYTVPHRSIRSIMKVNGPVWQYTVLDQSKRSLHGKYTVIRLKVHGLLNSSRSWSSVPFSEFQTKSCRRTKVGFMPTSDRLILKRPSIAASKVRNWRNTWAIMDEGNWIIFQNEAISGSEVGVMPTFVLQQPFLF